MTVEKVVPLLKAQDDEAPATDAAPDEALDPFNNLDSIRLDQSYTDGVTTKKLLTKIRVGKPEKHHFVRVDPRPAYRLKVAVVEDKEAKEFYLVTSKELKAEIGPDAIGVLLLAAVTRAGTPFLWLVKLPDADGNHNSWHATNLIAAEHAERAWVKVESSMELKGWEVTTAEGDLPEPAFSELPFNEMLRLAFRGKTIESYDHPLLRRIRGAM